MNWRHNIPLNRYESDLGYVVTATRGRNGTTHNAWLPAGAGYVPNSQSNDVDACKRACEEHLARAQANSPTKEFQR